MGDPLVSIIAEELVGVNAQPFDLVLEPEEALAVAERVAARLGVERLALSKPMFRVKALESLPAEGAEDA
jgi:hypothetical protein